MKQKRQDSLWRDWTSNLILPTLPYRSKALRRCPSEELFDKLKSENVNEIGEAASEIGKISKHTFDNNLWIKHKTIHNLIVALYKVEHRFLKNASKEDVKKKKEVEKQIIEALRNITENTKSLTYKQWDEYMEEVGKSYKYMP